MAVTWTDWEHPTWNGAAQTISWASEANALHEPITLRVDAIRQAIIERLGTILWDYTSISGQIDGPELFPTALSDSVLGTYTAGGTLRLYRLPHMYYGESAWFAGTYSPYSGYTGWMIYKGSDGNWYFTSDGMPWYLTGLPRFVYSRCSTFAGTYTSIAGGSPEITIPAGIDYSMDGNLVKASDIVSLDAWMQFAIAGHINHTHNGGDWDGYTGTIPAWTSAAIYSALGETRLTPAATQNRPTQVSWCFQARRVLNLLRWTGTYGNPLEFSGGWAGPLVPQSPSNPGGKEMSQAPGGTWADFVATYDAQPFYYHLWAAPMWKGTRKASGYFYGWHFTNEMTYYDRCNRACGYDLYIRPSATGHSWGSTFVCPDIPSAVAGQYAKMATSTMSPGGSFASGRWPGGGQVMTFSEPSEGDNWGYSLGYGQRTGAFYVVRKYDVSGGYTLRA